MFSTLLTNLALLSATGWASYVLEDDYMSGNFFDQFSFFDGADPTNGFVSYAGKDDNLISGGTGGYASFGVDNSTNTPGGRPSVRLTSNKSYQSGLFVLDVAHMPGGICGTWPAFWTVGPDWPNQGEIDIIEGVNDQNANDMTLHTGPGCTIGGGNTNTQSNAAFSGSLVSTNCVSGNGDNQGCQIATQDTASYGSTFNSNGGGVYAMEWTSSAISIYFFPRGSVPSDVLGSSPNPSSWGTPMAVFSGGCDMGTAFTNQQIVFDTTFCGDWAGQVWSGSSCAKSTGSSTCEDFVANHPSAFDEAYWTVNGLKVYSSNGNASPAPSAPAPSAPAASSTIPLPSGWGSQPPQQSTFQTAPSAAPAPSGSPVPEISGVPGWPAPSGQGQPSAAPAPSATQPSPVPEFSGRPQWSATQTWGGDSPWQSGGWTETENEDGSFVVGRPVHGSGSKREADAKRIHSRHLAKHLRGRHGAGLL